MQMLGPARYLADFARVLAARETQECDDARALAELQARPLVLPEGLELEWLGVSRYGSPIKDRCCSSTRLSRGFL